MSFKAVGDQDFTIKTMTVDDLERAVDWAAGEGWNPGLHDAQTYYSADPNGFLMGYLGDEPVASISAVKYGDAFGFIGFYIVKPEYRGQGYGLQIWKAALAYLDGCNIALDGVVEQQDNYKKSGFTFACRNVRYEGTCEEKAFEDESLVDLTALPFEEVAKYAAPFFPADRTDFVRTWITQPEAKALGVLQDGQLRGCGVVRPCRNGYKIGPLFADTPERAEILLRALKGGAAEPSPLFLDVPQLNAEAVSLAEGFGMHVTFETARMYTGPTPELPWERMFGITSFEIG